MKTGYNKIVAFVFILLLVSFDTLLIIQYLFLFECTSFTIVPFDCRSQNLEKAARLCFLYYTDAETNASGLATTILKFQLAVFMHQQKHCDR